MSRTFRRKNYESTRGKLNGSSVHKHFPQDLEFVESNWHNRDLYGHGGRWIYRAPTKQEFHKEYWRIHRDSKHAKAWGPDRYYCERYKAAMRTHNEQEWQCYLKTNGEYEPMFLSRHRHSAYDEYRWY